MEQNQPQTSLHHEDIFSFTLLWFEEILSLKFDASSESFRRNISFCAFTGLRKILNNEFFDVRISTSYISAYAKLNTVK